MMKELRDQTAHMAAALAALLPLSLWPCALSGAWAGFCVGLVREVTEEGAVTLLAVRAALGSWLDLSFWALGGAIAGWMAHG